MGNRKKASKDVAKSGDTGYRWKNFDEMTPAERSEMSRRGNEAKALRYRTRKLAELEVYTEAHRELAARILGSKMGMLDGLQKEMETKDEDGNVWLDTSKLDATRLKLYLSLLDQIEKRAFGGTVTRSETKTETTVDVRTVIAKINRNLSTPDDDDVEDVEAEEDDE